MMKLFAFGNMAPIVGFTEELRLDVGHDRDFNCFTATIHKVVSQLNPRNIRSGL
jgi:hypothetical protein